MNIKLGQNIIYHFSTSFRTTLKEKGVLKQSPWGTILENGAFFDKKDTILVPLIHQNKVVLPCKRAPLGKWHQNGVPIGNVLWTIKRCPPFWCYLFFLVYAITKQMSSQFHYFDLGRYHFL